jgi:hypothetical protein
MGTSVERTTNQRCLKLGLGYEMRGPVDGIESGESCRSNDRNEHMLADQHFLK